MVLVRGDSFLLKNFAFPSNSLYLGKRQQTSGYFLRTVLWPEALPSQPLGLCSFIMTNSQDWRFSVTPDTFPIIWSIFQNEFPRYPVLTWHLFSEDSNLNMLLTGMAVLAEDSVLPLHWCFQTLILVPYGIIGNSRKSKQTKCSNTGKEKFEIHLFNDKETKDKMLSKQKKFQK